MEPITERVRAMYERYPYPTRTPGDYFDSFPQLSLSYRDGYRRRDHLTILDAGCGTGACSLGTAICNPTCQVVAIDLNRQALSGLREEAGVWELSNLQITETDIHTLNGLEIPEGGFDIVICGGVLHHLSDPVGALTNLRRVLAPDGVMRLMVYNTLGRQALYRFVKTLNLIHKEPQELEQRLKLGRSLLAAVMRGPLREAPWEDGVLVNDVEFVDRYLNLQDTSYSVSGYMEMLEEAGLSFLRWFEPQSWELEKYLDDPALLEALSHQSDTVRYELVEHLSNQVMLDAYVAHEGSRNQVWSDGLSDDLMVGQNPQVLLQVWQQIAAGVSYEIAPRAYLRARPSVALESRDHELLKKLAGGPLPASSLLERVSDHGRVVDLLKRELVYGFLP